MRSNSKLKPVLKDLYEDREFKCAIRANRELNL